MVAMEEEEKRLILFLGLYMLVKHVGRHSSIAFARKKGGGYNFELGL